MFVKTAKYDMFAAIRRSLFIIYLAKDPAGSLQATYHPHDPH